jgi:mRNA guanylyltransferase
LKWKAPSENSIDFKLELKFPSISGRPADPDWTAKPAFKLLAYYGDDRAGAERREGRYDYFDLMDVSDEVWEQ